MACVPRVVDQILRLAVRADHDGVMARPDDMFGNGAQHARPALIAHIRIRPHDIVRHAIIHAIRFRFPPSAAIKAVVAPVMLADVRAFQRVPVVDAHRTSGDL